MKASDFDLQLEELNQQSVGRLMTAEEFDLSAFRALYAYLCEKATNIKSEHVVSKQVLRVMLWAPKAMEGRAKYDPVVRQNMELVRDFARLLDLIAIGEDCNDRKPGVPRVFP
jgi:hypothetical protein